MKRKKTTISEKEIRAMLKSLREEVAAPPQFRAGILKRLALEAGQAAPSASLWQRLIDLAARPALVPALALSGALGFGIWFATRPLPQAVAPVEAPAEAKVARPAQLARVKSKPAPIESAALSGSNSNAVASGKSDPMPVATHDQFSALPADSVGAAGLPTATPNSGPGPQHEALAVSSQVRRNRFLASRGEYAAILFKLKAPGRVRIEIYDRNGKRISVLQDEDESAGTQELRWYGHDENGQLAPTGIYAVRIMTPEYNDTHKIVLVR